MKKKLFDSFVDLECPWCNEKLYLSGNITLICKECQKWDHQWGGCWSYDRVNYLMPAVIFSDPIIRIKEYYERQKTT